MHKLRLALVDKELRNRILFVAAALIATRLLAAIPIPGINKLALQSFFQQNQFLDLVNIFSGGGLSKLSIVMLGVGPYITGSIIMQLLTVLSPNLKAMYSEEGEIGRRKFSNYSRLITVPLALIQAYSFIFIFSRQGIIEHPGVLPMAMSALVIAAGSLLLMWIGELITEFGIGNGVSLIIFAGIVSRLPGDFSQIALTFNPAQIPVYLAALVATVAITYAVVYITEAERPIPVTYAKQVRGNSVTGGVSTYLPLRLNQAGVIPIIFALSLLLFPQMIFNALANFNIHSLTAISTAVTRFLNNQWYYGIMYFFLVVIFTYFYTAVTFDPDAIAKNLQKNGAFIPGVRPGNTTSEHIARILTRLTLVGALFLGIIAVLPLILKGVTGISSLAIGGTALLIVVSVALDLVRKVDAQISIREY